MLLSILRKEMKGRYDLYSLYAWTSRDTFRGNAYIMLH